MSEPTTFDLTVAGYQAQLRDLRAQLADARAEIERLKAQLRTSSVHDELAELTAENAKLSAVVSRYARHDEHCHKLDRESPATWERVCTCGLNAALEEKPADE